MRRILAACLFGAALVGTSMAQVATSYSFSQSAGTFTAINGGTVLWNVTNVSGTDVGTFDNNVSAAQTIPAFNFNGTVYTRMYVSSNGFITFGSAPAATNYSANSSAQTYAGAVAPLSCNLQSTTFAITATRDVRWEQVGSEVVVQWRGVRRAAQPNEGFSFQVRLNTATNGITFVYGPFTAGPNNYGSNLAQCGLRGPNNTFATQVNNRRVPGSGGNWAASVPGVNNASLMYLNGGAPITKWTSGQTYTWTPCTPVVTVTPASPIDLCSGSSVGLSASGAANYTWSPGTGLSATTGASVTASPTTSQVYTVSGTNTGCAFTGTTTATVNVQTPTAWYDDNADHDGFGDPGAMVMACTAPPGYVADGSDSCPELYGRQDDTCDDGNPFTSNDHIDSDCICEGTPAPTHNWTLRIVTDGAGSETSWEIRHVGTNYLMASGSGLSSNSTVNTTVSIPDTGNFALTVFDSGNNGIGNGGGYLLRDHNGSRVIDNLGNGAGFTDQSKGTEGFFSPVGTDALRAIDCDNEERWPYDMIVANANAAVSAQWQVGDQTDDGYEFWFTDPNGGYSRHVFRNHATSGGFSPANAGRACKLALNSFAANPLPQGKLLNVHVRGRVNGVNMNWGPACRMKVDPTAANCHTTQLESTPGTNFSCGVVGLRTNGSSRIWAKPVNRYVHATNSYIPANKYRWHCVNVGENTSFDIITPSYPMLIYPSYGFTLGATYNVTVQGSFDNGTTYCPAGNACLISFAANNARALDADAIEAAGDLLLWPNPNHGDQLNLRMTGLESANGEVGLEVVSMFGERVLAKTFTLSDGALNTVLDLDRDLASGLYLVNLTAGGRTITKRLVVQR